MTTPPSRLSDDDLVRYSRQLLLPQWSGKAQRALQQARVLCIGAGGLGSPALLYLAAAGVGHLTIIDGDAVDLSNLQRQVLHSTPDVGRPKAVVAAERLRALNPGIAIVPMVERFAEANAAHLVREHDVVVDGSDNFTTRYLTNDACFFERKPLCFAAVLRFEGQASTFRPGQGDSPCYRCLFPEPPEPGSVPSCAEAGILGMVVGQMGLVQAGEVVKLLIGVGEPLIGRLLLFDGLRTAWREVRLRRQPTCPLCGPQATIAALREETLPRADGCALPRDRA